MSKVTPPKTSVDPNLESVSLDQSEATTAAADFPEKKSHTKAIVIAVLVAAVVLVAAALVIWYVMSRPKPQTTQTGNTASQATTNPAQVTSLVLDTNKNYGNKYANGILPVGDNKYDTTAAKQGNIYLCRKPGGGGGAGSRGPWFINNNQSYDINKKLSVQGSVPWDSSYSMNITGDKRVISTNDLPNNHNTGVFPIASSDPAHTYDANPNSIAAQSLTYNLPATPVVNSKTGCVGGEVGVMTTGVALFDGFDAGGRDAGAWEVQDGCSGHPQNTHEYHYHTMSSCIKDTSVSTVIGYALDGFPITGPKVGENNILTTTDLDECHGITSTINLDGKQVTTYHYVMTQDFPYSLSCFRGTATQAPRS